MKILRKKEKGITLIALVVTIIVLLILAGVSISMLTGENGILTQAQNAKERTEEARQNEVAILDEYNEYLNNVTNGGTSTEGGNEPTTGGHKPTTDENGLYTSNSTINGETTGSAMNPIIPAGFKPIDENGATWGDGTSTPLTESVNNGLVIEDGSGNQFVWIPVASASEYVRNTSYVDTSISAVAYTDTGYLPDGIQPTIPEGTTDEKEIGLINENAESEVVTTKGGFYISRYEAGRERVNKPVSKSGATVWRQISQEDCKTTAKAFINNEYVKSALCSGIQWDVTMAFVNGKQDGAGNTFDVTTNGDRGASSQSLLRQLLSGQYVSDRVCNIFDLEKNYYEFVAERTSYYKYGPIVYRGGDSFSDDVDSASTRRDSTESFTPYNASFRFVLYVM